MCIKLAVQNCFLAFDVISLTKGGQKKSRHRGIYKRIHSEAQIHLHEGKVIQLEVFFLEMSIAYLDSVTACRMITSCKAYQCHFGRVENLQWK